MALVKDIMSTRIRHVPPDATICDAARVMGEFDVGSLPVIEDDKVVGLVTDRDIVVRSVAKAEDVSRTAVRSAMTPEPACCHEDDDVDEVARKMGEKQIRRMLVLNPENKVAGICSLGDVASGAETDTAGKTLEDVSRPSAD